FQAEDGIRDLIVTGVRRVLFRSEVQRGGHLGPDSPEQAGIPSDRKQVRPSVPQKCCRPTANFPFGSTAAALREAQTVPSLAARRSEERRVGTQSRSRSALPLQRT